MKPDKRYVWADVSARIFYPDYAIAPVITSVLTPGSAVHTPVSGSWLNVAAGTVMLPFKEINSPVAVL